MSSCFRKYYEHGPWWEKACLRRTIQRLELAGKDATFEKELFTAFEKVPEYKNAVMPDNLSDHYNIGLSPQDKDYIPLPDDLLPPANAPVPDFDVLEVLKQNGGRPRKESELSRTTVWRREKESQGVT